jgi:hypothetical protein
MFTSPSVLPERSVVGPVEDEEKQSWRNEDKTEK